MIMDKTADDVKALIESYKALSAEEKEPIDADLRIYLDYLTNKEKISLNDIHHIVKLIHTIPIDCIEQVDALLDFSQQDWFVFCKQYSTLFIEEQNAKQQFIALLNHQNLMLLSHSFHLTSRLLTRGQSGCLKLINKDTHASLSKLILILEDHALLNTESLGILMPYVASIPEASYKRTLEYLCFTFHCIAKSGLLNQENGFENILKVLNNQSILTLGAGYKSMGCKIFINPEISQAFFDELFNKHTNALFQEPYMHLLWEGLIHLNDREVSFLLMELISGLNHAENDIQTMTAFYLLNHPKIFNHVMMKYGVQMSGFNEFNQFILYHVTQIREKNSNADTISLDKEEARFYFLILRHLLMLNNRDNYPTIQTLLSIPAIAHNAHIRGNDLFMHALKSPENMNAAIFLLTLPNVRSHAEQNAYYIHETCALGEAQKFKRQTYILRLMRLADAQMDLMERHEEEDFTPSPLSP